MKNQIEILDPSSRILCIRNQNVMIDADLASIYGVTTKRLNEQVKRNLKRFPLDFMFQLNQEEKSEVVANCDHLQQLKFSSQLPYAFTEHGTVMLASVLNSDEAVKMSVAVVRAFNRMRRVFAEQKELAIQLDKIGKKVLQQDDDIQRLFEILRKLIPVKSLPMKRIGYKP